MRGRWRRSRLLSGLGSAAALSLGLTTVLAAPALAVEVDGEVSSEPTVTSSISGRVAVPEGVVLAEGDIGVVAVHADAVPTELDVFDGAVMIAGSAPSAEGDLVGRVDKDSELADAAGHLVVKDAVPVVAEAKVLADGTYQLPDLDLGVYKLAFVSDVVDGSPLWYKDADNFAGALPLTLNDATPLTDIDASFVPAEAVSSDIEEVVVEPGDVTELEQTVVVPDEVPVVPPVVEDPQSDAPKPGDNPVNPPVDERVEGPLDPQPEEAPAQDRAPLLKRMVRSFTEGGGTASISGKVTLPAGVGTPEDTYVVVFDEDWNYEGWGYPDEDGDYQVAGLAAGSYKAQFRSYSLNVADQWWTGADGGTQYQGEAAPIVLAAGASRTDVNANMVKGATISGKVTLPTGVSGVTNISVSAQSEYAYGSASVEEDGTYQIVGLPAGSYNVGFSAYGLNVVRQWWTGADGGTRDQGEAAPIVLAAGASKTDVNATMVKGATISGKVTLPTGVTDVTNFRVSASDPDQGWWYGAVPVEEDGTYQIVGLAAGTYNVQFYAYGLNVVSQWWTGTDGGTQAEGEAAPIVLAAGASRADVNANMVKGATISGKITLPTGVSGITNVNVSAEGLDGNWYGSASVEEDGTYEITGLSAGSYKVQFSAYGLNVVSQWWTGADGGTQNQGEAAPIVLAAGASKTGVNANMVKGATISGKVTLPTGVSGVTNISVSAQSEYAYGSASVEEDGTYEITGLPAGSYKVQFSAYGPNVLDQWWTGADGGTQNQGEATPIVLAAGASKTGVNANMVKGATISGKVTLPTGISGVTNVNVSAYGLDGNWYGSTYVEEDGTYEITGLPAGSYKVQFSAYGPNVAPQWWTGADGGTQNQGEATPIVLAAGASKTGVNANMVKGATISGKVTLPMGVGDVTNVSVSAQRIGGDWWSASASVEEDGTYEITGLAEGSYKVEFSAYGLNVVSQWWTGAVGGAPDMEGATPIVLAAGASKTDVNATMAKGATISGKVTLPTGISDVTNVSVYVQGEGYYGSTFVEEDGTYEITGLPAGSYKVEFSAYGLNVVRQWWTGAVGGALNQEDATPVVLAAGASRADVNANMVKGATISGKVTLPTGISGVTNVNVSAEGLDGNWYGSTSVEEDGTYEITGLPAGSYKVEFSAYGLNVVRQWWNGTDQGTQRWDEAIPAVLAAGASKTDVNATMVKGATISGKVTLPIGLGDVSQIYVSVFDRGQGVGDGVMVEPDGTYKVEGLPAGRYIVEFYRGQANVAPQWWNDTAGGSPTQEGAMPVVLGAGATKSDVNANLVKGATITGRVTVPGAKFDVTEVWVSVSTTGGNYLGGTYPDVDGKFSVEGLPAGAVIVKFYDRGSDLAMQWWDGTPVGAPSVADAKPTILTLGETRTDINASLVAGATISGTVVLPPGVSLDKGEVLVGAYTTSGELIDFAPVRDDFTYEITGLPAAKYTVMAGLQQDGPMNPESIALQWWNDSIGGANVQTGAKPITVGVGGTVGGINFTLAKGGKVSVTVKAGAGVSAASGWVEAYIYDSSGWLVSEIPGSWSTATKDNAITFKGLAPGTYKVEVKAPGSGAVDQWWNNKATRESADPIVITSTETKEVAVTMSKTPPPAPSLVAPSGVKVSGTATVGQVLSVTGGGKADFSPAADSVSYQWLLDGASIVGATSATYKLVAGDAGKKISVRVTGVKAGYTSASATSTQVTVAAEPKPDPGPIKLEVRRLAGDNRYLTNIAVNSVAGGVGNPVFVATGSTFADALSIGPAVALTGGTLFLTAPSGLSVQSLQAIKAKNPSRVYVVGGEGAVSPGVANQLRSATGKTVTRIDGQTRYETSANIFTTFFSNQTVKYAFVATGRDYPDALSAAAAGGALGAPVLLVDGMKGSNLSKQMLDLLGAKKPQTVYVAGGTGVVNPTIESNLSRLAPVKRLSGNDRYKTNAAVNAELDAKAGGASLNGVWIATGRDFPDALSAAAPAGNLNQRLVLSTGSCVPKPVVSSWIKGPGSKVSTVSLVGGAGVLAASVQQLQECK